MVNWKRRRKGALSWGRVESRLLKWQRRQIGEPAAEKRQLTQRRQEARAPGAGRWGGKDGLELLTPRVKAPSSRNPCVLASLRCLAPICSQAAKVLVDELPREAFGVRPACWRCREVWGGPKAGASSTHSKRFAQFDCSFAVLCLKCRHEA